jgi:hypothetical protein
MKLALLVLLLIAGLAGAKLGNTLEQTSAQYGHKPAETGPGIATWYDGRYKIVELYRAQGIAVGVMCIQRRPSVSITVDEYNKLFAENFPGLKAADLKKIQLNEELAASLYSDDVDVSSLGTFPPSLLEHTAKRHVLRSEKGFA